MMVPILGFVATLTAEPTSAPVVGLNRSAFEELQLRAHIEVPSYTSREMFEPVSVMVRVTDAVDMSMSVTVLDPLPTNKWPLTITAAPGFAPTEMGDPTIAPVDGLIRSTLWELHSTTHTYVPS